MCVCVCFVFFSEENDFIFMVAAETAADEQSATHLFVCVCVEYISSQANVLSSAPLW